MAGASMSSVVEDYTQLDTIPAILGILFAVVSAVQFLGATISLETPSFTFQGTHAMLISLGILVVVFASSETNDWRFYDSWEQAIVAGAVLLIVGNEFVVEIQDLISASSPASNVIAFLICMAAWGVLAR